jgi:hypothetical protein
MPRKLKQKPKEHPFYAASINVFITNEARCKQSAQATTSFFPVMTEKCDL